MVSAKITARAIEERFHKIPGYTRLRLRRFDGKVYLDRWGIRHKRIGRIYIHRMSAPDPGTHLHDHPFWFTSFILSGGYFEERSDHRKAIDLAVIAGSDPATPRGTFTFRRHWTWRSMRLDECHRITMLTRPHVWTLVIGGPDRRPWGFFTPIGWLEEHAYDHTYRGSKPDLWNEIG